MNTETVSNFSLPRFPLEPTLIYIEQCRPNAYFLEMFDKDIYGSQFPRDHMIVHATEDGYDNSVGNMEILDTLQYCGLAGCDSCHASGTVRIRRQDLGSGYSKLQPELVAERTGLDYDQHIRRLTHGRLEPNIPAAEISPRLFPRRASGTMPIRRRNWQTQYWYTYIYESQYLN